MAEFGCSKCERQFRSQGALEWHLSRIHSSGKQQGTTQSQGTRAAAKLGQGSNMAMRNIKMSTFGCPKCGQQFQTLYEFNSHFGSLHSVGKRQGKESRVIADRTGEGYRVTENRKDDTEDNTPRQENHHTSQFVEEVGRWQRSLLQLDRRNNLLYFRPGKSAVRIVGHSPESLYQKLSTRRSLTFDYAEPPPRRSATSLSPSDETNEDQNLEPLVISGDLTGDCPPVELQRRLKNLQRRDREWEEEQGLNVLFVAFGLLEWVDEEGEVARSPLLLFPGRFTQIISTRAILCFAG